MTRLVSPRLLVPLSALAVAAATAAGAHGFWTATGQGTAGTNAGTLASPSVSTPTPGAGTVSLSWAAVTPPPGAGPITYYVRRDGGPATGCPTPASPTNVTSCTDTGVPAGSHSYTVTSVWHTWSSTSSTVVVTLASGVPTMLAYTAQPSGAVAGATLGTVTVAVEDAMGNIATADNSTVVTIGISTNPGGGTLSGGGQRTVANGIATYSGLSVDKV